MMRVRSDENLFNAWREFAYRVETLNRIVQNDIEITEAELGQWSDEVYATIEALKVLATKTYNHVLRGE